MYIRGGISVVIRNEGKAIKNPSSGTHPVKGMHPIKVEGMFIDENGGIVKEKGFSKILKPMGFIVEEEELLFYLPLQENDCDNIAGVRLRLIQDGWDSVDLAQPVNIMFCH